MTAPSPDKPIRRIEFTLHYPDGTDARGEITDDDRGAQWTLFDPDVPATAREVHLFDALRLVLALHNSGEDLSEFPT